MAVIEDMTLPAAEGAVLEHHQGRLISLYSVIVLKATHRRSPCKKNTQSQGSVILMLA